MKYKKYVARIDWDNINKILIIGGTGMGKSTLADNLGCQLNMPVYHLDAIHFKENWQERDVEERDNIIDQKIDESKWILDGLYKNTLNKSMEESDLVIILWFSKFTQLKGIIKRHIKNYKKERKDIPGCIDKLDFKFIRFTLNFKKNNRNIICKLLQDSYKNKVIIFRNQIELNRWYRKKFKSHIKL